MTALFYLLILIMQEKMVQYYVLFALLKGISTAFYWLGYFIVMYDVSNDGNRYRYLGMNTIVTNIASLLGPVLGGIVIARLSNFSGYMIVFACAFLMFFVSAFVSMKLEKAPMHHKTYYLKFVPDILRREPGFMNCLIGWFVVGLPQGILMYVPQIMLYHVFPNEEFVGYMNVLFFTITLVSSYIIARSASNENTRWYLLLSAIGFTLSASVLLYSIAVWSVIVFMAVNSWFKPLQQNAYAANYYQWMGQLPLKKYFRVESMVLRETVINFGRAAGVGIFMLCSGSLDNSLIPWIVVGTMAAQFFIPAIVKTTDDEKKREAVPAK